MNLQDLINQRKSLPYDQERKLIHILGYGRQKQIRLRFEQAIKNKFFTVFDGQPWTRYISFNGGELAWIDNKEIGKGDAVKGIIKVYGESL